MMTTMIARGDLGRDVIADRGTAVVVMPATAESEMDQQGRRRGM
tara:strand:- start:603 stop:734 length:132 start_codon:yes stop_codon:yes gene_type:complete